MDLNELARRRLASQAVTAPVAGPAEVVERLLAVQGQDWYGTLWAVGLRCGADAAAVEAALERREIVRTWPMRGTLHLVPRADARWMIALLTPRVLASTARRRAQLELDEDTLSRARTALEPALAGQTLTRAEALQALESAGISTAGQRGYHILFHLAQTEVLLQVGRDVFAAYEDVLPAAAPVPREEALARLARRYFTGHGPATEQDLGWWCGLPLRDVRAGLAAVRSELVREDVGGVDHWSGPSDDPPEAGVHLLPGFDELLLGYRDRTAVLDPRFADRVCPGGNGMFRATALVDGRMVGTWKARAAKTRVTLEVEPFGDPVDLDRVRPAAERHARFLGKDLRF